MVPIRRVLSPGVCLGLLVLASPSLQAWAAEVYLIYPPSNSLITESPVAVLGYVLGSPETYLEAKVVSADGSAPPRRQPLSLLKGKVVYGAVDLEPGRNNLVVGDSVVAVLYRPGASSDREEGFRMPRTHAGSLESCTPCHGFRRGELTLKGPVEDLCLSCHEVGTESLRAPTQKNEHTRLITPDCLRCHDPHVSFEEHLLRTSENLCTPCHEDYDRPSRHDSAALSCAACHDPHASAYPNLLKGEALPLCHECHRDIANPRRYPRSYHRPAEQGRCFDCHEAHPGVQPSLLSSPVPDLCRTCHFSEDEGAHQGQLEECRACHASHLSDARGLLTGDLSEKCTSCHGEFSEGTSNHPALKEGCVSCHNPHRPYALADSQKSCGRCHSLRDEDFRWSHGSLPMTDVRQCTFCHEPHRSEYPHLLRGEIHYPLRNGGCGACHVEDSGTVELKYEGSKNCVRCHGQITGTSTIVETEKVHKPVYQIDCIACHNPHMGVREKLLLEEPVTLCGWCHGILLRGVSNLHGVFKDGGTCYTCHLPHISDFVPLLKRPEEELCTRCHLAVLPDGRAERQLLHGALAQGKCSGCHNPHGTNEEKLLKDSKDAMCRSCHADLTRDWKGTSFRYLHGPVGSGNCTACHEMLHRHREENDDFLREDRADVCSLCHATAPEHVPSRFQAKMREVRNDCLACHVPHGADNSFLLRSGL